jgi:hypothetical protein
VTASTYTKTPSEIADASPNDVAARRRAWTAALRSGNYVQGFGALRTSRHFSSSLGIEPTKSEFCCLGVAEKIHGVNEWRWNSSSSRDNQWRLFKDGDYIHPATLSTDTATWLGLLATDPVVTFWDENFGRWRLEALSVLNDTGPNDDNEISLQPGGPGHWTFAQIADVIDAQPANWIGTTVDAQGRVNTYNQDEVRP